MEAYSYLLGLYLGDGTISAHMRGVFCVRIVLDQKYPNILAECEATLSRVLPNRVGRVRREGCIEIRSYSKHWLCLFPQRGPGMKHKRDISLVGWQKEIAFSDHPRALLRGLVHSDGCRVLNWVNGTAYPRYHFSNRSDQIHAIFREVPGCRRCELPSQQPLQSFSGATG